MGNTWRLFHNPDPMQFSGGKFHMDASSVIDVTTSDIVFAQVSRAYALASSWSGTASASASASVGYNSGSFGGYAWSMSGGKNLLISQPVQQPVQPQQPVVTQVTNNPVLNQPVSNASASPQHQQLPAMSSPPRQRLRPRQITTSGAVLIGARSSKTKTRKRLYDLSHSLVETNCTY